MSENQGIDFIVRETNDNIALNNINLDIKIDTNGPTRNIEQITDDLNNWAHDNYQSPQAGSGNIELRHKQAAAGEIVDNSLQSPTGFPGHSEVAKSNNKTQ